MAEDQVANKMRPLIESFEGHCLIQRKQQPIPILFSNADSSSLQAAFDFMVKASKEKIFKFGLILEWIFETYEVMDDFEPEEEPLEA